MGTVSKGGFALFFLLAIILLIEPKIDTQANEKTLHYIEEYGGGVGVADNSSALLNAIKQLNGTNSVLIFRSGSYHFASTIDIDNSISNLSIQGLSQSATVLCFDGNCDKNAFLNFNSEVSNFSLENFRVELNSENASNQFVIFDSVENVALKNMCLINMYGGIKVGYYKNLQIERVMMLGYSTVAGAYGMDLGDEESKNLMISQCSVDGNVITEPIEVNYSYCCRLNGGSNIYLFQNDFCNFGNAYGLYYATDSAQNNIYIVQNDFMRAQGGIGFKVNGNLSNLNIYQNNFFAYGSENSFAQLEGNGQIQFAILKNDYFSQGEMPQYHWKTNGLTITNDSCIDESETTIQGINSLLTYSQTENTLISTVKKRVTGIKKRTERWTLTGKDYLNIEDGSVYVISNYVSSSQDDAGVVLNNLMNTDNHAIIIIDNDITLKTPCKVMDKFYGMIIGITNEDGTYTKVTYTGTYEYAFRFGQSYQWGNITNIILDCNGKSGLEFDGLLFKGGVQYCNIMNAKTAIDVRGYAYCYFDNLEISGNSVLIKWDKTNASSQAWLNEFAYCNDIIINGTTGATAVYDDTGSFQYYNNVQVNGVSTVLELNDTSYESDNWGGIWNNCTFDDVDNVICINVINKYITIGKYVNCIATFRENTTGGYLLYFDKDVKNYSCKVEIDKCTIYSCRTDGQTIWDVNGSLRTDRSILSYSVSDISK